MCLILVVLIGFVIKHFVRVFIVVVLAVVDVVVYMRYTVY